MSKIPQKLIYSVFNWLFLKAAPSVLSQLAKKVKLSSITGQESKFVSQKFLMLHLNGVHLKCKTMQRKSMIMSGIYGMLYEAASQFRKLRNGRWQRDCWFRCTWWIIFVLRSARKQTTGAAAAENACLVVSLFSASQRKCLKFWTRET